MTHVGSLCTGYGGLDLAVHSVLGGELAWVADTDPGAAAILGHRFPGVPNLGDINQVNWLAVTDVDVLTAGFPCQDVSCAGARKGLRAGTRTGVWSRVATAIDVLRPSLVVLENVRGLLSAGADSDMEFCPWCLGETGDEHALRASGAVLGDLADLGFNAEWAVVSAASAGAPHRRERVFILAWPAEDADGAARGERRVAAPGQAARGRPRADAGRPGGARAAADTGSRGRGPGEPELRTGQPDAARGALADTAGGGQPARDRTGNGRSATLGPEEVGRPGHRSDAPADANGRGFPELAERDGGPLAGVDRAFGNDPLGRVLDWGPYGGAIARWESALGRSAPQPTVPGKTAERLNPAFVEWMQGLPGGWVTDVPGLSRNAMLKALGNGVVPQQAELALRLLLDRADLAEVGEAA